MEKVFSLIDSRLIAEYPFEAFGSGVVFLCQKSGFSDISGENTRKTLSTGDCFVGEPNKQYFVENGTNGSGGVYFIFVNGSLPEALSELYGIKPEVCIPSSESTELFEEVLKIKENGELSEQEKNERSAGAFHKILYNLYKSQRSGAVQKNIFRIKEYMDSHIEEKVTLDTLSKIFFISKTQIFRLFKEEYGLAPMQYFLKEKTELAKKRLLNTELKISEISDSLSFSDAKHFTKTFYKYTGMLPSIYRKIHQV